MKPWGNDQFGGATEKRVVHVPNIVGIVDDYSTDATIEPKGQRPQNNGVFYWELQLPGEHLFTRYTHWSSALTHYGGGTAVNGLVVRGAHQCQHCGLWSGFCVLTDNVKLRLFHDPSNLQCQCQKCLKSLSQSEYRVEGNLLQGTFPL